MRAEAQGDHVARSLNGHGHITRLAGEYAGAIAALNVGSGEVLHDTRRSHTGRDVLAFFRWIDMHVDPDLELHVILDNLSAHKSQPVRDWLAHKKRRRWHLHFTPTSSSWLERALMTIRRGFFQHAAFTSAGRSPATR